MVCVGNTWLTEKEETDRFSLKLNSAAEDLILDVAQVNPNVIVVIYAGSAVDVSAFEGKVKAILYMG
ncbi:MAG: glycoside hydrolase family 3 C-terminal domain-containing protein, partial [Christensenellaceae bacterium]